MSSVYVKPNHPWEILQGRIAEDYSGLRVSTRGDGIGNLPTAMGSQASTTMG